MEKTNQLQRIFFKIRDVLCQLRLATLSLSNLVLRSAHVLIRVSLDLVIPGCITDHHYHM